MRVVVTANGEGLDAPASPVFGRCPYYVFVDTETMAAQTLSNPAVAAGGGAGVQAAQYVVQEGAQAVITGNVGPNAFQVFQAAGVPVYLSPGGTVRQAVEAFKRGALPPLGQATAPAHAGMGRGMASRQVPAPPPATPSERSSCPSISPREQELAELRDIAAQLRRQLAEVMERIEKLEKGGQ